MKATTGSFPRKNSFRLQPCHHQKQKAISMQRHNEQTIGEILNRFLKASQLENRIFEDRLAAIWQETLGDTIAAETVRIHLQNGLLFVDLRSPSLRNELLMRRTAIMNLLNEKLETEIIKQIVIR